MKSVWFFYVGTGINGIALLVAACMMLGDMLKGHRGTNNPIMFSLSFLVAVLIVIAWWLKNTGKVSLANTLLWIPATPLLLFGLFVLLFIIIKPDMR